MEIVPVIDLKGGIVVHARMGDRTRYQPINTPLSATSAPIDVVDGLMRLGPFAKLYIADLDAITQAGDQGAEVHRLGNAHPTLDIWTDRGSADGHDVERWLGAGMGTLVLGSESQTDPDLVAAYRSNARIALSLDFRGDVFQGPTDLLEDASLWPARLIVMTLARVGSGDGPDLVRLQAVIARAGSREVFAAGGLRDFEDGRKLKEIGVAGVLAASALHNGALTAQDIARLK